MVVVEVEVTVVAAARHLSAEHPPRQREVVEVGVEQAEARDHERARRGAAREYDVGGGVVSHEEEEERL